MSFRALIASAALAIAALSAAPMAQAATTVSFSAASDVGTTVFLDAGSYEISFLDTPYSGWSFWGGSDAGCNASGTGCAAGYTNLFNIASGGDVYQVIKFVTGSVYGYGMYGTLQQAFDAYSAGGLSVKVNSDPYVAVPKLLLNVAPGGASTKFYIQDSYYGDNGNGGVSLLLTAVPEPASWAMMIGGFGAMGVALRRRRQAALAA